MPKMYVIAGCNGAGKTTVSNSLLPHYLNCNEFVNADMLAAQIKDSTGISAAKRTFELVRKCINQEEDFAIETTLSGLSHQRLISLSRQHKFEVILIFTWLASVDLSLLRVAERVELGGHHIPEPDIRRRYKRGLVNLFDIYIPLADYWVVFDNTDFPKVLVAEGSPQSGVRVLNSNTWLLMKTKYNEYKKQV